MTLPSIHDLESLVPELTRLSCCHKSDAKQINNFSTLMLTASRLWIIEKSLYCPESDFFVEIETEWFDCITWLREIENKIPNLRDRSLEYFILGQYSGANKDRWQAHLLDRYKIEESILENILASRLFGVVNKTLRNNFKRLATVENPRLEKSQVSRGKYKKTLTSDGYLAIASNSSDISQASIVSPHELTDFFYEGVSSIAELLLTKFHGTERLFIQAEYVAKESLQERAADWADNLKEVWKQEQVNPIEITYSSASQSLTGSYIVYPVAIHHSQRAFYLYAWGEAPQRDNSKSFRWYSYRLERILKLNVIAWERCEQTKYLKSQIYRNSHKNYYTPRYIREQLEFAYGFNFHYRSNLMLLRFNSHYHKRYIKDTIRHSTFKQIHSLEKVKQIISQHSNQNNKHITLGDRKRVLEIVDRYPDDAYYTLRYRVGDNNVIMRLRSWGFNVEVILPWNLRQETKGDLQKTSQFYSQ